MAQGRDRLNDPNEALKAAYGARVNNEVAAALVGLLVIVALVAVAMRHSLF